MGAKSQGFDRSKSSPGSNERLTGQSCDKSIAPRWQIVAMTRKITYSTGARAARAMMGLRDMRRDT